MTIALIKNNSVIAITDASTFSGDTPFDGGNLRFACPGVGAGWASGVYSVVVASYTDTPPANSAQTGWNAVIVNGAVQITRTWQAVAPRTVTQISPLEFRARFTSKEQSAIFTAALANPQLFGSLLQQAAAQYIDLTDPVTIAGVNALVAAGLLTSDRATIILAQGVASPQGNA